MNQVVENVRPDFDEVGVDEAVLNELLRSWETKMAMSRTADWSNDPRVGHIGKAFPPVVSRTYVYQTSGRSADCITQSSAHFAHRPRLTAPPPTHRNLPPSPLQPTPAAVPAPTPATEPPKKVEDGAADDAAPVKQEGDETAPAEPATAPAPAPAPSSPPTATPSAVNPDDDEINSDLDDDDDDENDEDEADMDLVVALYEKVHRVKNKWKVTLKDGLISVGGKEYLFAKCTG